MGLTYIEEINEYNYDDYLAHYGVGADDNPPGRGSGRYEKGSGENPNQHLTGLAAREKELKKQGMTESEIAKYLGFKSTVDFRARKSIEKNDNKIFLKNTVPEYSRNGMSVRMIAKKLGISESSVRNYLDEDREIQIDKTTRVANMLKDELKEKHYLDVGPGVELDLPVDGSTNGISRERMKTALTMLTEEGYQVHMIKVEQAGNPGKYTTISVLAEPDSEWKTVQKDPSVVKTISSYVENDGTGIRGLLPVQSIDSSRVYVRYAEEGGDQKDGLIELRRGVEDISLGKSAYAQVRIGVDGDKYMKGVAVYADDADIPPGYDIIYNSNKKEGTPPEKVFKMMEIDKRTGEVNQANPFGATVKKFDAGGQSYCLDQNGNPTDKLRVINKVNDQGDWQDWSKTISPQSLSKQGLPIIKRQLELTYNDKRHEFDEIMSLTNPTIRRKLLESFADDCDASAVHLKALKFPGQASHVLIPITSLKEGEIYAPNYKTGEKVALIRYPFAGPFECPILTVNNNNEEGKRVIGQNAPDAVGITKSAAETMSGADYDGDTATVIPIANTHIESAPRLKGLVGFDTKTYKFEDDNAKGITSQGKQTEMGKITNLIADMQIKGADKDEIERAVKHSMVVIDSEKHHLDYRKSEIDNDIQALKDKYQDGGGASTLITRAGSEIRVDQRKYGTITDENGNKHYAIDPETGQKILVPTGKTYEKYKKNSKGEYTGESVTVVRQEKISRMEDAFDKGLDAKSLMSSQTNPYPVELAYANYANDVKALANEARRQAVATPKLKRDPQVAKEYEAEVKQLEADLIIALKNAPRERQAQIIANANYKSELEANPEIKNDKDACKKLKGQCLQAARDRVGAKKQRIKITDREWEAIQKGAISDTKLRQILDNTDSEELRKRATPRNDKSLTEKNKSLAKSWAAQGYNTQEIAERLGLSSSTISRYLNA